MQINAINRSIPDYIEGYGPLAAYEGRQAREAVNNAASKLKSTLAEALLDAGIKDGMTISFHHHLRDGDYVLNMVMDDIARLGIKNLTLAASSLQNVHEPIIRHIKDGVVAAIITSGIRGALGKEISYNDILGRPVVFQSHGRRAAAICGGETAIDITFIAASSADKMGNMSGKSGKSAFGSMGYALVDAEYAGKVICITDNLVDYPLACPSIYQTYVDAVVVIDEIGDAARIASGATRTTRSATEQLIADFAGKVLIEAGMVAPGFSFQAGSGGISLGVLSYLADYMTKNSIVGSFISGGITSSSVELLEAGLFRALLDTQTFDANAVASFIRNRRHIEMSASMYANPYAKGCVANLLDVMILSATEVDVDFNINVLTGSNGVILGAVGGHPDTAECAKITVVTAPSVRKNMPIIRERVTTVVTPGEFIDIVVTDIGIAVNPRRSDLVGKLAGAGLPIVSIHEIKDAAYAQVGAPAELEADDECIVGIVESRDGTVLDVIKKLRPKRVDA